MSSTYKKQGFCGSKKFGFYWNETERSEDNFWLYGEFNIFANNAKLLDDEFTYNINEALYFLKRTSSYIKDNISNSDDSKENLYMAACRYRKYWTYIEQDKYEEVCEHFDFDSPKVDEILEQINKELNKYEALYYSGGIELDLYSEISDQGWRIFLFRDQNKTKDRVIYSNNNGKNVFEVQLELGTVARVLSELPNL